MRKLSRLSPLIVLLIVFSGLVFPFAHADIEIFEYYLDSDGNLALRDHHPSDSAQPSSATQSFQSPGFYALRSVQFALKEVGAPTGTAYARLYAHSGTFGTNSVPTGSALASSSGFDVSTLTGSEEWYWFNFTGDQPYVLDKDEFYVIAFELPTAGTIDGSNYIHFRIDTSSPTHTGNYAYYENGAYIADNSWDIKFRLWGEVEFYLSTLIDQSFSTFGILDYIANATAYGTALGTYFIDSITNIVQLITQQFLLILGVFDFFIDWYTRMVSLVVSIGDAVTGLLDGTGTITTGLGNVWDWISFGDWIDIVPVFLFIWWVDSITRRGERQGEITVFFGDLSTIFNVTNWVMSMFGLIINTVTDLAFRLIEVIT